MKVFQFLNKVKRNEINLNKFQKEVLREAEKINKKFNAFINLSLLPSKQKGRLFGLPISIKDCICTKGITTTAGSKILSNYVPPFDATCIKKIKEEGGFIIGKTAMDSWGFGSFSTNCDFGIPKNPWDAKRTCGGSSGGAACHIAATKFPAIAIAESTGGSISCPACFCGVVGLTPTYGRVSRWGLISYANSLDKIGMIAKNVYDAALGLSVISGKDEYDSTSLGKKEDFTKYCVNSVKRIKIGVPKEYFENIDVKVKEKVWEGIKKLESLGASYKKISLPMTKYSLASYYTIASSEASTNLAKYCGLRYGMEEKIQGTYKDYFSKVRTKHLNEESKRRIMLGTFARMSGYRNKYYLKAMKVRTKIIKDFKKAFKKFDVLIAPTMPFIAPRFDEINKLTPIQQWMFDILTIAPNLAGIPHLSISCGFVEKMPVGMHILSDHMREDLILRVAHAFELNLKLRRSPEW